MANTYKLLGQLRPANTTSASVYSPASGVTTIIKCIVACNTSGSSAKYRIFLDDDGTTYDENTAIFWDVYLGADQSEAIDLTLCMNNSAGNLAVRTDTADAITFTIFGLEISA